MPVFLPLYPSIQMLYFPVFHSWNSRLPQLIWTPYFRLVHPFFPGRLLLTHFERPQSTLCCCRWHRKRYRSPLHSVFPEFLKRFLTWLCPDMSDHPRRFLSSVRLWLPVLLSRKRSQFRDSLLRFQNRCRPGICCSGSVLPYQQPHHLLSYQWNCSRSESETAMLQS